MPYNLHSLSWFTIAYMIGIAVQAQWNIGLLLFFIIIFFLLLIGTKIRCALSLIIGCSLFFVGGMVRFLHEQKSYEGLFTPPQTCRYSCTGRVYDIVAHSHSYFKKRITVITDKLTCTTDPNIDFCKTVFIYLYVPEDEESQIDDEITISNIAIKHPHTSSELIRIMRSCVVASIFDAHKKYVVRKASHYSWGHYIYDMRMHTTATLGKHIKKSTYTLYTSLFLGSKTDNFLSSYLISRFNLWGISHHLARSGLHLIIIMWLWLLCIKRIPISNIGKNIFLIFLCAIYYILSWSSLSFDRACLSYALHRVCFWNNTPLDTMHAISLVICIFLLKSPAYLLCLDFQLSFGLTYALAWFNHAHTKLEIT